MKKLTNILLISREDLSIDAVHSKVLTLVIKYKVAGFLRLKQFSTPIETLVGAYSDIKKILSEDEDLSAVIIHNFDNSLNKSIIAFFKKDFGVKEGNICILPELNAGGCKILEEFIAKWQQKLPETDSGFLTKKAAAKELFQFN